MKRASDQSPLSPKENPRLPQHCYLGAAVAFTLCVDQRRPVLNGSTVFESLYPLMVEAAEHFDCMVLICLFMPDHLHCILSGRRPDSDPLSAIKRFKQRSGYWSKRSGLAIRWQRNFYDHIIRNNDDLDKQISYVLDNPVRAALVVHWRDYPWKGSTVLSF